MIARSSRGLTLIETLVSIVIIALLGLLIVGGVQSVRESSRRVQCMNNLRQVGVALNSYQNGFGTLPPAYATLTEDVGAAELGKNWGWGSFVLPQIEQVPLFNSINFSIKMTSPESVTVRRTMISTFSCPSSTNAVGVKIIDISRNDVVVDDLASSNYIASAGSRSLSYGPYSYDFSCFTLNDRDDGAMYQNSRVTLGDVIDGTSSTFLVGERSANLSDVTWVGTSPLSYGGVVCTKPNCLKQECVFTNILVLGHAGPDNNGMGKPLWVDRPNYVSSHADGYWSYHASGCNFVFCDGSTRFVRNSVSPQVFTALSTRAKGELLEHEF